jgi:hypothetical protein
MMRVHAIPQSLALLKNAKDRGTQKVLRKLEDAGEISIVINPEHHKGKSNLFYLNGYRQSINLPPIKSTKTLNANQSKKTTRDIPQDTTHRYTQVSFRLEPSIFLTPA